MSLSTFSHACCPFWIAFLKCLVRDFDLFFIVLGYLTPLPLVDLEKLFIYSGYETIRQIMTDILFPYSFSSHTGVFTIMSWKTGFKILVKPRLLAFAFCLMFSFCCHLMTFLPCSRTWRVFLCYCLQALLFYFEPSVCDWSRMYFLMWCEVWGVVTNYFHVDIELLHHHFVKTPSLHHTRAMTLLLKVRWHVAQFLNSLSVLLVDLFILLDQNHIIGVTVPWNKSCYWWFGASQVALVVKGPPANTGHRGSIPRLGRFPWRRARHPTPVFLPGESHGQRSLADCGP